MEVYSVNVKELEDERGGLYFEIPPIVLKKLGWKAGDDVKFLPQENGSIRIKKVQTETIELNFDDDELFKYMQMAHENNMSFNEFVESALEEVIKSKNE
jgi:antitoxin component of MazEF toxin-antitoxin module